MNDKFEYIGSELELFREARNWKATLQRQIQPFVQGDVLEVGAGIGSITQVLRSRADNTWTCLEPDPNLAASIPDAGAAIEVRIGNLESIPAAAQYHSILYIDVLEHIENDEDELRLAAEHLEPDGYLVVLAPAHQWLYSPFDRSIGHHRRYNRKSLRRLQPPGTREVRMRYLDSFGLLASLANKFVLSQAQPRRSQIRFWDKFLVRASRHIDPVLRYQVGKSILMVWQRVT